MNPLNYLLLLLKVYKARMINMAKKLFQKKLKEQKEAPTMSDTEENNATLASLERGIAESTHGETTDRGSFASYAKEEGPADAAALPETALTYFKNANGKWQTALIKYDPVTKQATVESLGIENTHKEVVREEFILKNIHMELLT